MHRKSLSDPTVLAPIRSDGNSSSRLVSRWYLAVMTLLLLLPALGKAQVIQPDDIVGTWEAIDKTLKFEMFHAGSDYEARMLYGNKLVESDGVTFKSDAKNPDASLRSRSTKGIAFIKGLTWDKNQWSGGTLYDASSGKTYKCKVELKDGKLQLRGYMGLPTLGQTVVLARTNDTRSKP
jgi:uncharacterized protein (DUF2147 family)